MLWSILFDNCKSKDACPTTAGSACRRLTGKLPSKICLIHKLSFVLKETKRQAQERRRPGNVSFLDVSHRSSKCRLICKQQHVKVCKVPVLEKGKGSPEDQITRWRDGDDATRDQPRQDSPNIPVHRLTRSKYLLFLWNIPSLIRNPRLGALYRCPCPVRQGQQCHFTLARTRYSFGSDGLISWSTSAAAGTTASICIICPGPYYFQPSSSGCDLKHG